jgi:hypothetical protein
MRAAITGAVPSLRLAAARYRLGRETGDSLRALGEELLSKGCDQAVGLAIVEDLSMFEVAPVFERLCADLGVPIPARDQAIEIVTTAILRNIVDGVLAPEAGLQHLMDDVYLPHVRAEDAEYVGDSRGLQYLIGAYWSYDELRKRPTELSIEGRFGEAAVPLLDDDVRRLASDWLGAHDDVDLA